MATILLESDLYTSFGSLRSRLRRAALALGGVTQEAPEAEELQNVADEVREVGDQIDLLRQALCKTCRLAAVHVEVRTPGRKGRPARGSAKE